MQERRINLLPDKSNKHILRVLEHLQIKSDAFYLDIIPEAGMENGDCFENVAKKVAREMGAVVYGWQFCEYAYMIEAEFHAIWKSPAGKLVDITPGIIPTITKSLFAIDGSKKFEGKQIDNFRLNTTNNELVDDIITTQETRFRFMNKGERANTIGPVLLSGQEHAKWEALEFYASSLEQLYFEGWTLQHKCFCKSGYMYGDCHRNIFKALISSI